MAKNTPPQEEGTAKKFRFWDPFFWGGAILTAVVGFPLYCFTQWDNGGKEAWEWILSFFG